MTDQTERPIEVDEDGIPNAKKREADFFVRRMPYLPRSTWVEDTVSLLPESELETQANAAMSGSAAPSHYLGWYLSGVLDDGRLDLPRQREWQERFARGVDVTNELEAVSDDDI